MSPTTTQPEELAERAPRYLDQSLESRDHANQWNISTLWSEPKSQMRDVKQE